MLSTDQRLKEKQLNDTSNTLKQTEGKQKGKDDKRQEMPLDGNVDLQPQM